MCTPSGLGWGSSDRLHSPLAAPRATSSPRSRATSSREYPIPLGTGRCTILLHTRGDHPPRQAAMTFPLRPCGNLGHSTTRAEPRLHAWLRDALSHGYMPGCARHRAQWLTPPQPALPTCAPSRTPSASGSRLYTTQAIVHSMFRPLAGGGDQTGTTPRPPTALYREPGRSQKPYSRTRRQPSSITTPQCPDGADASLARGLATPH